MFFDYGYFEGKQLSLRGQIVEYKGEKMHAGDQPNGRRAFLKMIHQN